MMRLPRRALSRLFCLAAALGFLVAAQGALQLGGLFGDGAVLQREKPVPVWGWAAPGTEVQVAFHGAEARATAGEDGYWRAVLPAMPASTKGATLTVRAGKEKRSTQDVLVGEVWLCSGQSNMEWMVSQVQNAEQEIAAAKFPLIRQFRVPRQPAEQPQPDVKGGWQPATSAQVGQFSGVAYFFARDVHQALDGVPIGLINASWGGKMIEVFTPPSAVARTPHGPDVARRWEIETKDLTRRKAEIYPGLLAEWTAARDAAKAKGEKFTRGRPQDPLDILVQHRPASAFNAMIAPLAPYALRGVLWYQGEHNISRAGEYRAMFGAMITDWRERFGQGDIPFYFAQLSTFGAPLDKSSTGFAELREAQARALEVPATGMVVTVDIGTPDNIHPRNKQDVGARLGRIAKAKTYGLGGEWSGPVPRDATRKAGALRLTFTHVAGGLVLKPTASPAFEIAGDDNQFHPAAASIDGDTVVLSAEGVATPRAVRYAWANAPAVALFNGEGLPASPFRFLLP